MKQVKWWDLDSWSQAVQRDVTLTRKMVAVSHGSHASLGVEKKLSSFPEGVLCLTGAS